ncbi:MAG: ISAs1 family transposase [Opitutaceae bacterium]|nr:ISAs1 family transposase [Opitutaceae bacterium]
MPSESTFQRTLGQVDAALLDQLLGQWQLARTPTPAQLAVDGKALKGTPSLHLFSAFCGHNQSVLAQEAIPEKTNEIPQLAALLHDVPLTGVLVTADALHRQGDTARHLVQERGADYLLVVKANQPTLGDARARLHPEPVHPLKGTISPRATAGSKPA